MCYKCSPEILSARQGVGEEETSVYECYKVIGSFFCMGLWWQVPAVYVVASFSCSAISPHRCHRRPPLRTTLAPAGRTPRT
ncbi:hypothetical protein RJT34_17024 [Clitoria ternatea]|uniref:Uncharacterized protein n=1 Tax=Clitoria ternatea TaxID=43366 RepID=A0AAN9PDD5_CLITE